MCRPMCCHDVPTRVEESLARFGEPRLPLTTLGPKTPGGEAFRPASWNQGSEVCVFLPYARLTVSRVSGRLAKDLCWEVPLGMVRDQEGASGRSTGYVRVAWQWARSVVLAVILFLVVRAFLVEAFKIPTSSMEGTLLVGDYLLVNKAVYGAAVPFSSLRLPAWREPSRGEVIVFHPPHDPEKNYVKRVVGVPGDTLEMREKMLFVNGREMEEDYVRHIHRGGDATHTNMKWQRNHLLAGNDGGRRLGNRLSRSEDSEGGSSYEERRFRYDYRSYNEDYRPSRDNWGPISVPEESYFVLGDNRDNSEDSRYWGFVDRASIRGQPWRLYFSYDSSSLGSGEGLRAVRWERVGQPVR